MAPRLCELRSKRPSIGPRAFALVLQEHQVGVGQRRQGLAANFDVGVRRIGVGVEVLTARQVEVDLVDVQALSDDRLGGDATARSPTTSARAGGGEIPGRSDHGDSFPADERAQDGRSTKRQVGGREARTDCRGSQMAGQSGRLGRCA